jgi:hypothetical protein
LFKKEKRVSKGEKGKRKGRREKTDRMERKGFFVKKEGNSLFSHLAGEQTLFGLLGHALF